MSESPVSRSQLVFRRWFRWLLLSAVGLGSPLAAGAVARIHAVHDPPPEVSPWIGTEAIAPTAEQLALVEKLGAGDASAVRWNRFGTPHSLLLSQATPESQVSGSTADAARDWLGRYSDLFRLRPDQVEELELVQDVPLAGEAGAHVVLFRQRFGGWRPAGGSGRVTVGLTEDRVVYVSSSLVGDPRAPLSPVALSAVDAWIAAAADLGREVLPLEVELVEVGADPTAGSEPGWSLLSVVGYTQTQRARLAALPIPDGGGGVVVLPLWEVLVLDVHGGEALAVTSLVDAQTGRILARHNRTRRLLDPDSLLGSPRWRFFPSAPPLDGASTDLRILGCWDGSEAGCDTGLANPAARAPWDFSIRLDAPTFTTAGNAAVTATAWLSPLTPAEGYRPVALDRAYDFRWGNLWRESGCSPTVFTTPGLTPANDVDAAAVQLFTAHNRLHDWAYRLGFTEQTGNLQDQNFGNAPPWRGNDPEMGNVQAGAVTGGAPLYVGRNNASQITLDDGIAPITSMYLFQPVAASFYAPCTDGDFDLGVVAHEYAHAVQDRMVGGPDGSLVGAQAGAMGEGWSDLIATELLAELGLAPMADENPFAVGVYATGNASRGIRNYGMNYSPLNSSNVGYDLTGVEVHADGEIWSAVNFRIRQALVDRWNAEFPASDPQLQRLCAEGGLPLDRCPGNRRWIQLVYDSFLLMPEEATLVDARDALLAADRLRFGGAHQRELWLELARRGLGARAASDGTDDPDPVPDFTSPLEDNAVLRYRAVALEEPEPCSSCVGEQGHRPVAATLYIGDYEARSTPVAVTPAGFDEPPAQIELAPGTYGILAVAPGYGHFSFHRTVSAGEESDLAIWLPSNHASVNRGATISGNGVNLVHLIDDTEATDWARLGAVPSVAGTAVTVELADGPVEVNRIQVSALLRPADPEDPGGDTGTQNRFSALRQFEIRTCDATVDPSGCTDGNAFEPLYTSPRDAFPGRAPRPVAPDLQLRTFEVPAVQATHVRLVVLTNQCTGGPDFQGDQDTDPLNNSDCVSGSSEDEKVRAAELQVFSHGGAVTTAGDPAPDL